MQNPEERCPDNSDGYPLSLRWPGDRSRRLRNLIAGDDPIVAPGAFDGVTARLVEATNFPALYVTGSGISMSVLGAPDVGLMSFAEVEERVRQISDIVAIPVIADADTGYGGPLNIARTIRGLEKAGASAIQIEDQEWPKRCGHELGRRLAGLEESETRIKAAVDARHDPNVIIIARTDARTVEGIESALERAERYAEAGADVLFVESPESETEMRLINERLSAPTLVNIVEGGRTPLLSVTQLGELGYRVVIFPNSLTRLVAKMGQRLLDELCKAGSTAGFTDKMMDHDELWNLFEYERWLAAEARFASTKAEESSN